MMLIVAQFSGLCFLVYAAGAQAAQVIAAGYLPTPDCGYSFFFFASNYLVPYLNVLVCYPII